MLIKMDIFLSKKDKLISQIFYHDSVLSSAIICCHKVFQYTAYIVLVFLHYWFGYVYV